MPATEAQPDLTTRQSLFPYRMLNVVADFTRECFSISINRKLKSSNVIDGLSDLFILRGEPELIRSDNGSEFFAKAVQG